MYLREGVLSFADTLDGGSPQQPFANSLTATKQGFCNFQHCDRDFAPIAYGKWWEAQQINGDPRWVFTAEADHSKTQGGEFLWGAYGIGVDFARLSSLYIFSHDSSHLIFSQGTWPSRDILAWST